MMSSGRGRLPFTANQWQELEHQALIYKYMVSGMPVPPDLLYSIRRSLDSSLSSKLLLHQPPQLGWSCFQMGFGKKIDPEPGRCRRTDGKKWRCSKEAYPDSKYCERHMHRGRNRSRKPVEVLSTVTSTPSQTPPNAIPYSSSSSSASSSSSSMNKHASTPLLYTHSSSSRPHGIALSSHGDHTTNFLLDSAAYSRNGYGHVMKEEVVDEHVFFSEASGSIRSTTGSNSVDDDTTWQLAPLTMASSSPLGQLKERDYCVSHDGYSYLQLNEAPRHHQRQEDDYYGLGSKDDHQPKKVMHHFFDEWPKENKDSWLDSGDKFSSHGSHLSISVPNSSHDFFMTHNEK